MKKHISMSSVAYCCALIILSSIVACSKEKKAEQDTSNPNNDNKQAGNVAISENEFAITYPEGMALTAFPQAIDPTPGTAASGTVAVQTTTLALAAEEFDPFKKHPKERLDERTKRLAGDGDCFSDDIVRALTYRDHSQEICYGFDYGIVSGNTMGTADAGKLNNAISSAEDQTLPSIKEALSKITGLQPPAHSESCMVATGRKVVAVAAAQVEGALAVVEGMLCQAKKNGDVTLPDIGASIDLANVFSSYSKATISKAEISRLNDHSGRKLFRTTIKMKVNGGPLENQTFTMRLFHSPGSDNNSTYDGILLFEGDSNKGSEFADLSSISYSKSGSDAADQRLKFEIRRATLNIDKISRPYFSKGGRFNFGGAVNEDGSFETGDQNNYISNIDFFTFDINPSSYAGKIAFWKNPGGNFAEQARGFVYTTEQNTDGTLAGCAFAGAATSSIRKAVRSDQKLTPTGCYTPFIANGVCGEPGNNTGPQIFGQCFKQASDGYYAVDESKTSGEDGIDIFSSASEAEIPDIDTSEAGNIGDIEAE